MNGGYWTQFNCLAFEYLLTAVTIPNSLPPRVSVVMPVWNGEQYLRAAVESILQQTFNDFELIVVDDGSTDSTLDILRSFDDPRLRIFSMPHMGIVAALNAGVAHARANWIARQDADDISKSDRLELQWLAIESHRDAILCHTDFTFIGDHTPPRARFPRSHALVALKLCFQCPIVHTTVLFRKNAFLAAGGYQREERHAEDYALWTRMINHGVFLGIPKPLVGLRVHPLSVSHRHEAVQLSLTTAIAINHCERYLGLNTNDARRAYRALSSGKEAIADWCWFIVRCLPKLPCKSLEMYTWLVVQTLRKLFSA